MSETVAQIQNDQKRLGVFLCYAKEDESQVRQLHNELSRVGFDPWLDTLKVKPGYRWREVIFDALRACDAVVVCLSRQSVVKEGFVNLEIHEVCEREKQTHGGFLIPVILDDLDHSEIPLRLRDFRYVKLLEPDGRKELIDGLKDRAAYLRIYVVPPEEAVSEGERLIIEAKKQSDAGTWVVASRIYAVAATAFARIQEYEKALLQIKMAAQCIEQEPHKHRYFCRCLGFYYSHLRNLLQEGRILFKPDNQLEPNPGWLEAEERVWKDLSFILSQLEQLRSYSAIGLEGMRTAALLLRTGFPATDPAIEKTVKWIKEESAEEEDLCSIDNQCSLCTGLAASCLVLTQGDASKLLGWLRGLEGQWYVHQHPKATKIESHQHNMGYTAAVLEAFLDDAGADALEAQSALARLFKFRPECDSLLTSWLKFSNAPDVEVWARIFPAILRFRCVGGQFSAEQHQKLVLALQKVTYQLRKSARDLPSAGYYYPLRENIAALVLARELECSKKTKAKDLLDHALDLFRFFSDSSFFETKFRRRLLDSDVGRTVRYLSGWLSWHELQLASRQTITH